MQVLPVPIQIFSAFLHNVQYTCQLQSVLPCTVVWFRLLVSVSSLIIINMIIRYCSISYRFFFFVLQALAKSNDIAGKKAVAFVFQNVRGMNFIKYNPTHFKLFPSSSCPNADSFNSHKYFLICTVFLLFGVMQCNHSCGKRDNSNFFHDLLIHSSLLIFDRRYQIIQSMTILY